MIKFTRLRHTVVTQMVQKLNKRDEWCGSIKYAQQTYNCKSVVFRDKIMIFEIYLPCTYPSTFLLNGHYIYFVRAQVKQWNISLNLNNGYFKLKKFLSKSPLNKVSLLSWTKEEKFRAKNNRDVKFKLLDYWRIRKICKRQFLVSSIFVCWTKMMRELLSRTARII